MIRSWGLVALTGAAQPWFGDVTTAAIAATGGDRLINVKVASTTRYRVGDRIVLEPTGTTTTNQDTLLVEGIPDATTLQCASEGNYPTKAHASGVILELSIACMDVIIQSQAAGAVWLGADNTVAAAGAGSAFFTLATSAAAAFRLAGSIGKVNSCRTSDGWMIGTGTQTVSVSAVVL